MAMLGATVPEAPGHEHRQARSSERYIDRPPIVSRHLQLQAVAHAACVEFASHGQLRFGVLATRVGTLVLSHPPGETLDGSCDI